MARLVYVDETGSDGIHSSRHPQLVLAAVLVPEDKVMPLHDALRDLTWKYMDRLPSTFEFHGEEIWQQQGYWKGRSYSECMAAYEDAVSVLARLELHVAWSTINKAQLHARHAGAADRNAYPLALQFLIEKIDQYDDGHLQLVIADEKKEHELQAVRMVADMQQLGLGEVPGRRLKSVIDSLHYVQSVNSPGVQMADLVAYAIQRHRSLRDKHPDARSCITRIHEQILSRARTWREPWPQTPSPGA